MELPLHKCFFFCLKAYAHNNYGVRFLVQATACGLTLSIAGWIADIHSGRYKLSMLVMWAAILLTTMSSVLARVVDSYTSHIHIYVNGVLWTRTAIGFGAFQANVIQFGIDQLHDSSSDEIASYILWYAWTLYGDCFAIFFVLGCLQKQYLIVLNLMIIMCI